MTDKPLDKMTLAELLDALEAAAVEMNDDFITTAAQAQGYTNQHGWELVQEIRVIILRKFGKSV
jgi:hypothetical protein